MISFASVLGRRDALSHRAVKMAQTLAAHPDEEPVPPRPPKPRNPKPENPNSGTLAWLWFYVWFWFWVGVGLGMDLGHVS